MIKTDRLPEFSRDLKKLIKRYKTLEEDLDIFIKAQIKAYHELNIDNGSIFEISGFDTEEPKIYKAKKFACKALKGKGAKSGIRVIYSYYIELQSVKFIEIYHKGDKENEDRERIKEYLKGIGNRKEN
ncbi:MAG: hypothetical protein JXN64_16200 [Spirochaetes bacterium]|nr:hypothetical protein [Spirochaetota bacterium]